MRTNRGRISRHLPRILLGATIAGVLGPTTSAEADDSKLIDGSACSYQDESTFLSKSRVAAFTNTSGASRVVTCPITKDILGANVSVFLRATGTVPASPITVNAATCRVLRREGGAPSASIGFELPSPNSIFFPDESQDVEWFNLDGRNQHFSVRCTVPNGGSIFSVQWSEIE